PNYLKLKEKLAKELAGYKGELALIYPLSFLPDDYHIFHDIRLNDGTHFFQNDNIILTNKCILLIEVKNLAGTLYYDQKNHQLTRTIANDVQAFDSPVTQVRRHKLQLEKRLSLHNLPSPPIHCLIAHSHPDAIFSSNDPSLDFVIRTYNLPEKITEIVSQFHEPFLTKKQFEQLSSSLLKNHCSHQYDYASRYKVSSTDIQNGVHCSNCGNNPMGRKHGTWQCQECGFRDGKAHIDALKDYFLFFGPPISNGRLRTFLRIGSASTANRILSSLHLEHCGENRGRIYKLKFTNFD
ncbi:nuclease-related domain-containing protein, partial [Halobacillus sp. BBL2006]|uniref:nuclease-related domain-containing protein n=1 Tax=Halobacillus sp. BBL2006 TaxID=1543706 RepID=UPI00054372DA